MMITYDRNPLWFWRLWKEKFFAYIYPAMGLLINLNSSTGFIFCLSSWSANFPLDPSFLISSFINLMDSQDFDPSLAADQPSVPIARDAYLSLPEKSILLFLLFLWELHLLPLLRRKLLNLTKIGRGSKALSPRSQSFFPKSWIMRGLRHVTRCRDNSGVLMSIT